jgi:hypothetical protein
VQALLAKRSNPGTQPTTPAARPLLSRPSAAALRS